MTREQLGEIKKTFKPGLENLVAGLILGVLAIGAGCTVIGFEIKLVIDRGGVLPFVVSKDEKDFTWLMVVIMAAIGIGLIYAGVFLIGWVRSLFSLRVLVGPNGFAVIRKDSTRVHAWEEIASVEETHLHERSSLNGPAKLLVPARISKSYSINIKEGDPFGFDENSIRGYLWLAYMIKKETDRRGIAWEVVDEHL